MVTLPGLMMTFHVTPANRTVLQLGESSFVPRNTEYVLLGVCYIVSKGALGALAEVRALLTYLRCYLFSVI